jgi:hypothetical protein
MVLVVLLDSLYFNTEFWYVELIVIISVQKKIW